MSDDDFARRRLLIMHMMRWTGVVLVMIGLLGINGRIAIPRAAAYILLAVGLSDALIVPTILARRWRSPRP
jgi:hypothetical protein